MKKLYSLLLLALAAVAPAHAQWNTNATPVCIYSTTYVDDNGQTKQGGDYYACSPLVARTPDKKTWISWKTWGHKMVNGVRASAVRTYLQLLDRDGVPQFSEPIMVNDHITPSWWSKYGLCVAPDGSAIVTVSDARLEESSYTNPDNSPQFFTPAIYKIDQEGNFLWGLDGVEFTQFINSGYTNAYVLGDDTYFLFFSQADADQDDSATGMYMMRIDGDGVPAWSEPRKMGSSLRGQILPSLNGDFLYFDDTPDGARVHRFDRDLNEVWGDPVIYDEYAYGGYEMNHYRIVSDGNGGACVAFQRFMGQFSHNIRVQHINEDGSLGFGLSGLDAYNAEEYDHAYPSIAANPETQEIVVQYASQLAGAGEVRHQKFSFDGDYLYDEKGMTVASKSDATSGGYYFGLTGVGALPGGSWVAIYRDLAAWGKESIMIRVYDKDGNRTLNRTIGRELNVSDLQYVVEPEAIYLFYREGNSAKNPGINIFRITPDGKYDVDYDAIDAISTLPADSQSPTQYYTLDGKQLAQPQHGLNLVRRADGTVVKQLR